MILIVTGGRGYTDKSALWWALDILHKRHGITFLSCGDANGADALAVAWGKDRGVQGIIHKAHWERQPKWLAGPDRNARMIATAMDRALLTDEPVRCLAAPGGRGTANCVAQCRAREILVEDMDELLNAEVGDHPDDNDPPVRDWGDL